MGSELAPLAEFSLLVLGLLFKAVLMLAGVLLSLIAVWVVVRIATRAVLHSIKEHRQKEGN